MGRDGAQRHHQDQGCSPRSGGDLPQVSRHLVITVQRIAFSFTSYKVPLTTFWRKLSKVKIYQLLIR